MKNIWLRIIIIFILAIWGIAYIVPWNSLGINPPFQTENFKLGLDLKWWIELDYKINLETVREDPEYNKQKENSIIEQLKLIVDKRIGSLDINDSVITTASYWDEKHIIVQIPLKWKSLKEDKENIERVKAAVWKVVKIMFKELRLEAISEKDFVERENIAKNILSEVKKSKYNFFVTADQFKDSTFWVKNWTINLTKETLKKNFWLQDLKIWLQDKIFTKTGSLENQKIPEEEWFFIFNINKVEKENVNLDFAFVDKTPSEWIPAQDSEWNILDDRYFVKSWVAKTEAGIPQVELIFNDKWGQIFWELTKRVSKRAPKNQIAIFVWGELLTSPNVSEPILGWRAVITGSYSDKEANELANNINTWVIPAPIYLTSERTIDSKLGWTALESLVIAWATWFAIIFLFLIIIYRFAGLMAWLALLIYVIFVLVVIKVFWNILTLASIAGLILSVGIAIDANILIFERIKDELRDHPKQERKKSIQVWFDNSWSAIWDSNITGLIISIILFIFWVNMIKWFGLMLGIWIIVSLITAMWVSRILILSIWKEKLSTSSFIGFNK